MGRIPMIDNSPDIHERVGLEEREGLSEKGPRETYGKA